jgi:hypothetical protein
VESCQQLQDTDCALEYAEKLVAVHPDDSEMMLLAIGLLQQQGSDAQSDPARLVTPRAFSIASKKLRPKRNPRECP